jgi:hypothetical protein
LIVWISCAILSDISKELSLWEIILPFALFILLPLISILTLPLLSLSANPALFELWANPRASALLAAMLRKRIYSTPYVLFSKGHTKSFRDFLF